MYYILFMGSIVCFKGRNLTMDYWVFMDTTRFLPNCFSENQHNIHPVHFPRYSWQCLCLYHMQAEYYRLPELVKVLKQTSGHKVLAPISSSNSLNKSLSGTELCDRGGTITVGYRGTFAFGRDGLADVKFRKIVRLLVCGKVWMIQVCLDQVRSVLPALELPLLDCSHRHRCVNGWGGGGTPNTAN